MKKFTIKFPIWQNSAIGICSRRLAEPLLVKIAYKTKDGSRLYPDTYIVDPSEVAGKPTQQVRSHTLIIFKIDQLKVYKKGRRLSEKTLVKNEKAHLKRLDKSIKEFNTGLKKLEKLSRNANSNFQQLDLF